MKAFSLIVDRKVVVWSRAYVEVEAESLQDAIDKAIKEDEDCEIIDYNYITETEEGYTADGITLEVMSPDYEILVSK